MNENICIYARYTVIQDNEAKIKDQFDLCTEYAKKRNWNTVKYYHDVSRSSIFIRFGFQSLTRSAEAGEFNVIICETPSRISRNLGEFMNFYKHMRSIGIKVIAIDKGEVFFPEIDLTH